MSLRIDTRAPDPQAKLPPWVEVDETWLSLGGTKRKLLVMLNAIMRDQVPWQGEPVTKSIHT